MDNDRQVEDLGNQLEGELIHLKVQESKYVFQDLWKNKLWIIGAFIFVLIWTLISSIVFVKNESWTFLHAAYFTVINITTVGFGDIVPATRWGKAFAGLNALVGLVLFGLLVSIISLALQASNNKRAHVGKSSKLSSKVNDKFTKTKLQGNYKDKISQNLIQDIQEDCRALEDANILGEEIRNRINKAAEQFKAEVTNFVLQKEGTLSEDMMFHIDNCNPIIDPVFGKSFRYIDKRYPWTLNILWICSNDIQSDINELIDLLKRNNSDVLSQILNIIFVVPKQDQIKELTDYAEKELTLSKTINGKEIVCIYKHYLNLEKLNH